MTLLWPYLSAIYNWFGYWAYITYRHNLWSISRTLAVWPPQRCSFSKKWSCSDLWVLYGIFAVGALLEIFKPTRQYSNSVWILDYSCCWSIQIVDYLCYVAVLFQLLSCMLLFLVYFSLLYNQCIFLPIIFTLSFSLLTSEYSLSSATCSTNWKTCVHISHPLLSTCDTSGEVQDDAWGH